jgi:hypothetical protein
MLISRAVFQKSIRRTLQNRFPVDREVTKQNHRRWTSLLAGNMPVTAISERARAKQVKLSRKGLDNMASLHINDFPLQVGSEKFESGRFAAAIFSRQITALPLQNPTITEHEIEVQLQKLILTKNVTRNV